MNDKGTKKKNQVVVSNIFELYEVRFRQTLKISDYRGLAE